MATATQMTKAEIVEVFRRNTGAAAKFADLQGFSRPYISDVLNGKRAVSNEPMWDKLETHAKRLLREESRRRK
jgi:transcriptional regulator with XRE-family HTH domain